MSVIPKKKLSERGFVNFPNAGLQVFGFSVERIYPAVQLVEISLVITSEPRLGVRSMIDVQAYDYHNNYYVL